MCPISSPCVSENETVAAAAAAAHDQRHQSGAHPRSKLEQLKKIFTDIGLEEPSVDAGGADGPAMTPLNRVDATAAHRARREAATAASP